MPQLKEAVADSLPVTVEQITGRSRSRTVCRARQVAIYLSRKLTGASLTEIGRAHGGLSHSTVKHAIDKVSGALGSDEKLTALVKRLERSLRRP